MKTFDLKNLIVNDLPIEEMEDLCEYLLSIDKIDAYEFILLLFDTQFNLSQDYPENSNIEIFMRRPGDFLGSDRFASYRDNIMKSIFIDENYSDDMLSDDINVLEVQIADMRHTTNVEGVMEKAIEKYNLLKNH